MLLAVSILMSWSDLKNDSRFARAIKIGTVTGILVACGGMVREVWFVLKVLETRSRAMSDAIQQGLETRMFSWAAIGMLVTFILVIVAALFVNRTELDKKR